MQKIWICGCNGQIGSAINNQVDKLEYEILDTDKEDLDVTDNVEVLRFGEMNRPDVIINCSGMTKTSECAENPKEAFRVNALGARNLSIIASKVNAKLVQISTDDVFDGMSRTAYSEFDETNPQTIYGKTKLAGENYVKEFTYKHFIIRSTWVYGYGDNFVTRFLKSVDENKPLAIAADHYGSPTNANELAKFILGLIKTSEYGTYHATNKGFCSRYQFAQEILRLTGKKAEISSVPHEESDFSSVRPVNAVLNNFILGLIDIYEFPKWQDSLKEYLAEKGECTNE